MFEESVKICNEGLKKVCDNTTVGAGEEVRCTFFFSLQMMWLVRKMMIMMML